MRGSWPFANPSTMNRNLQRITAALLLGSYGLAVAVSGAFHTHPAAVNEFRVPGHAGHGHESTCRAHHHREPAGRSLRDGRVETDVADSCFSGVNSHGDGCAVCSFLAHKPVQTTLPVEEACSQLAQALMHLKAIARVEEPFSAIWSRGPPPVA